MATARENMLKIFRNELPEYVPIVIACDPFNQPDRRDMPAELDDRLGEVQWQDTGCVEIARWLGVEVFSRKRAPVGGRSENCVVNTEWQGNERHTCWVTPYGELNEKWRRMSEGSPMFAVDYLLKNEEDLKIFTRVMLDEEVYTNEDQRQAVVDRKNLVGEDGIAALAFHGSPLGQLVRVHAGVENLAYFTVDCPGTLYDVLAAMEDNYLRQLRLLAPVDADAVWCVDDTSTTTISPTMFREFEMPYIEHAAEILHEQGKTYIHHSCGLIKDLVDLYSQTQMDVVHGLCTPPLGDITLVEARAKLGPDISIMSGLVEFVDPNVSVLDACAKVRGIFKDIAPGNDFMLILPAHPSRTIGDMACVVEECEKHRRL